MLFYRKDVVLFVLFLLLPAVAAGFVSRVDEAHPFAVTFDDTGMDIHNGQGKVEFQFSVPAKYYLYREAFAITVETAGVRATLTLPESVRKYDSFQEEEVDIYQQSVMVLATFSFSDGFDSTQPVVGQISYQGCSDRFCYRFMQQPFSLLILTSDKTLSSGSWMRLLQGQDFAVTVQHGFMILLVVCFAGGVVTGFTPCVLPIIPLTLAFMGVSQATSWGERLRRMLPFMVGMALVNSALSLLSTFLGWQIGAVYQSPLFLGGLAFFFLAMALWMLGVFNVGIPSSLLTRIQRYQPAGWVRSNLYAGATLGILAMPCVGPLQVALLAYIATSQDWVKGIVGMTSYSLGLAAVFLGLSVLSQGLMARFAKFSVWMKRGIAMMLILLSLFYASILYGVTRHQAGNSPHGFLADLQQAKVLAQEQKKPLLIDFFADWCVPCHEWNDLVFADAAVRELLRNEYITLQINCTTNTAACDAAVREYDVIGWPTLIFVGDDLKEIADRRIVGYVMSAAEFKKYLMDILAGRKR